MRRLGLLLLLSGVLQLAIAATPDAMGDLMQYRFWARGLAQRGLVASYWPPQPATFDESVLLAPIDYPPVFPYLLWAVGRAARALPGSLGDSDRALDFLIRVPEVLAVLATAGLLFAAARGQGLAAARSAAALFALNPAVVFDTAYWGQADAIAALPAAAAFVCLDRRLPLGAGALLAAAALTKPTVLPLMPLAAFAAFRAGGRRGLWRGVVGWLTACAALLSPFAAAGRLGDALRSMILQMDVMPYLSVNAHNLWWILGRGLPWTRADAPLVGPVTGGGLGLVLAGAWLALCLRCFARDSGPGAVARAAGLSAFGFFVLSTHMHENHWFLALPLLLLVPPDPPLRRLFLALSATCLLNMALHDPWLGHVFGGVAPGPRVALPQRADLDPRLIDFLVRHGYLHLGGEMRGEATLVWAGLTLLNAQANVLLLVQAGLGLLGARAAWAARPPLLRAGLVAAFLVLTGAPFLWHAAARVP